MLIEHVIAKRAANLMYLHIDDVDEVCACGCLCVFCTWYHSSTISPPPYSFPCSNCFIGNCSVLISTGRAFLWMGHSHVVWDSPECWSDGWWSYEIPGYSRNIEWNFGIIDFIGCELSLRIELKFHLLKLFRYPSFEHIVLTKNLFVF